MLSITHYQRNANQNHNEISSHTGQNDYHQKIYKQYCLFCFGCFISQLAPCFSFVFQFVLQLVFNWLILFLVSILIPLHAGSVYCTSFFFFFLDCFGFVYGCICMCVYSIILGIICLILYCHLSGAPLFFLVFVCLF